ncbi:MAG: endonuclease domain-containing protein [Chloroflexi bacterium]|nr:endonuclease domain-containing protein [Chloroflexota bacterium]
MSNRGLGADVQIERARTLRRSSTDAETALWRRLRARQVAEAKFRRQQPFGPYILDFCCLERRLVIEVDGGQHADGRGIAADSARTVYLEARGLRVVRFTDREVLVDMESVLHRIWNELEE